MKTYGGPARPDAEVENGLVKISVVQAACFLGGKAEQIYLPSSSPWPPRDHLKEKDLSWECKYVPKGFSERKNGSSAAERGFVNCWPVNLRLTFRTVRTHQNKSHSTSVLGWMNQRPKVAAASGPANTIPLDASRFSSNLAQSYIWRHGGILGSALLCGSQPSPGCLREVVWNGCTVCTVPV